MPFVPEFKGSQDEMQMNEGILSHTKQIQTSMDEQTKVYMYTHKHVYTHNKGREIYVYIYIYEYIHI